jgi:hypothetical protein
MFCPQCSQEQINGQLRFCSRCGFPLRIVSQLVAGGGSLPGFDAEGNRQLSPRQKGIRLGGLLMIISAVLIPIVILMTAMKSDLAVLFFPVLLLFVIGLTRLLYAYLLQERMQQKKSGATIAENTTARMRSAHATGCVTGATKRANRRLAKTGVYSRDDSTSERDR